MAYLSEVIKWPLFIVLSGHFLTMENIFKIILRYPALFLMSHIVGFITIGFNLSIIIIQIYEINFIYPNFLQTFFL